MSVYVAGNSHVDALIRSGEARSFVPFKIGNGNYEREPFFSVSGETLRFTAEPFEQSTTEYTGRATITRNGDVWGFLMGHPPRIYRHPSWRRFEPAAIAKPGKQPIGESALRSIIDKDIAYVVEFFRALRGLGVPFFAVSTPWPRCDHPCIKRGTRREVVAYLDGAYRSRLSELLGQQHIAFITPPVEAATSDGMLQERFGAPLPDAHHANRKYGRLMVQKIEEHLTEPMRIAAQ